ncbi:hypothetical protein MLD38_035148 [Melastoma candidum]|uniref:Uncharacterized protein n=1 Tax=Melastoma candidum TaxID=119954 RepID=A0ACB9MFE7_9MYRT|nr:hypothetical protein MLD38_035148 [Melastoma candidum]
MSPSSNPQLGYDYLSDRLRHSLSCEPDKPDSRELDLGSPVSPLMTRHNGVNVAPTATTTTTTSSSSSSSGSFSGRNAPCPVVRRPDSGPNNHSDELSGSSDNSPTAGPGKAARAFGSGQARSEPGSNSGAQSAVTSPPLNVLPAGNICPSGRVPKKDKDSSQASQTGKGSNQNPRADVLGSGRGNYGHGSILRGGGPIKVSGKVDSAVMLPVYSRPNIAIGDSGKRAASGSAVDAEEMKRLGNDHYKRGNFHQALELYDKAIAINPVNAAYRSNRAAALTGLGRLGEAVVECEVAVRLDLKYWRAHLRLASLFLRLGQFENAKRCLSVSGQQADANELQKLQLLENHLGRCANARKVGDWKLVLRECDAAITAGADSCSQLFMCRVEALLKLHQLEEAEKNFKNVPRVGLLSESRTCVRFFGMLSEAYPAFVRAQVELALGRFDSAISMAERAAQIDPQNLEVSGLLNNVRLIARARVRGNDLFKSERFTEACLAYEEGLRLDPSNSVLYCNRAACWFKLGQWEHSIEDCNHALQVQPNYTKAILRRAASNSKLERWEEAVRDYEILRREIPDDNEVAEALFHAQVALKKSLGEEITNMKFGGEVEEVQTLEQFKSAISLQGVSVVYFKTSSDSQCKRMSPFLDSLCGRYPSISFLKVDAEECSTIASAENVRIVPTFKIYKNGYRVKEIVCPSRDVLEHSAGLISYPIPIKAMECVQYVNSHCIRVGEPFFGVFAGRRRSYMYLYICDEIYVKKIPESRKNVFASQQQER